MKRTSLRFRLIALVLLITVCSISIVGISNYRDAKHYKLLALEENASVKVQTQANNLSSWLQTRTAQVEIMSRTEQVRHGSKEERLAYLQNEMKQAHGVFDSIAFADLDGNLTFPSGEIKNMKGDPDFNKALSGDNVVSDPIPDQQIIHIQVPVYDDRNQVIGVINAAIRLETAARFNLNPPSENSGRLLLLNAKGDAIYGSGHGSSMPDQSEAMAFYADVPGTDWQLALLIPNNVFEAPLRTLFWKTFITMSLAMLAMGWLLWFLINRETARIRRIAEVTNKVAKGNFQVSPLVAGSLDEIGILAVSVNEMTSQLRGMFERLDAIINHNDFAMMSLDERYVVNYFSAAAEKMLGYTAEEVIGKADPLWFIPQDELERVAAKLSKELNRNIPADLTVFQVLRNLHFSYDTEWIFVRKDGTRIPVMHNSNGIRDSYGQFKGVVSITRDITVEKRVQDELVRAKQEAEKANQAKTDFVARISHEIRTPLSGIIGLAQLLQKTPMSDIQRDYVHKMLSASNSMLALINEILDFSKVQSGKLELEHIRFSPEELTNKISDMMSVFLIGKDEFDFMIQVTEEVPSTLTGDPLRLAQVLMNLCSNAVKFTEKGYVLLRLDAKWSSEREVRLSFMVEDTGIGMSPGQLKKLFNPYVQADDSTSRVYGGTGLGLSIAKSLIEMMGGTLQVESAKGKGSRFTFELPFHVESRTERASLRLTSDPEGMTVWVVEDNASMRSHLVELLESLGVHAKAIDSWNQAFHRLELQAEISTEQSGKIICLMDMEAPDMYGRQTLARFKEAAADLGMKVLAMTTVYGRDEMNGLPPQERADGILVKPISRIGLYQSLLALTAQGKPADPGTKHDASERPRRSESVNGKILLAEDHEINRQVAIEVLRSEGFEVGIAVNGHQVLDKLKAAEWDLVLMDIQMPGMDGMEATRRIRSDGRFDRLPIIAMTANALPEAHRQYLETGMNDTVTKPIDPETLVSVIRRWIGSQDTGKSRGAGALDMRQSAIPQLKGIDVEQALSRLSGKLPIFMQMLHTFKRDYADYVEKMYNAYESGNWKDMKYYVHSLRGASGSLSAEALYAAASSLEDEIDSEARDPQRIIAALQDMERSFQEVIDSLKQL